MKKIIIGTLVATVIFFLYQTAMWMGGIHGEPGIYRADQDAIMQDLAKYQLKDGMYFMPAPTPGATMEQADADMVKSVGKPWAMLFYHNSMTGMMGSYMILGILYTLIACLIASMILYHGNWGKFSTRFIVSMGLAIFTLAQGVLDDMNWWSYPWDFVKPQVIDLTLGWAICSAWLAWYVKKPQAA